MTLCLGFPEEGELLIHLKVLNGLAGTLRGLRFKVRHQEAEPWGAMGSEWEDIVSQAVCFFPTS